MSLRKADIRDMNSIVNIEKISYEKPYWNESLLENLFYNSITETGNYKGVIYYDEKSNSIDLTTMDNEQFLNIIIEKLKSLKYNITPGPINDYTALPTTEKEFNEVY